ncbi:MAG: hypothetical protein R3E58_06465 [Phycisphaerae bacterium]
MIQFDGPLSMADRQSINEAGVRLLRPLGADAYFAVVESDDVDLSRAAAFERVADVLEIEREWKRHPLLAGW